MNEIDKIYLLHDFTEYLIEKNGCKKADIQAIDDFIQWKKEDVEDCYIEAVTCFDEIEDYLNRMFIDLEITR